MPLKLNLSRRDLWLSLASGLLLILLIWAVVALTHKPDHKGQAAPAAAAAPENLPTGAPRLWVLKDADSTIYLFGSIHVLPSHTEWMDKRLYQAFDNADEEWFEVADIKNAKVKLRPLRPKDVLTSHATLSRGLTDAEKGKLYDILRRYEVPLEMVEYIRPDVAIAIINHDEMIGSGFDRDWGVETFLEGRAHALNKPVKGLETIQFQVDLIYRLERNAMTTGGSTLKDALSKHGGRVDNDSTYALMKAWQSGDLVRLTQMIAQEKADDVSSYDMLLTRRNQNWVPKIETMLKGKGTIFVTVGAAHLTGEDSVIKLLEAKGYRVEPVL